MSDSLPNPLPACVINTNIVIKSALGTGKTHYIGLLIEKWPGAVIYISNRRTLSDAIANRLGFRSYEDISGNIDIGIHPRVVCQIDSLHRISNISNATMLIYDEYCSILSHINGMTDNSVQKLTNFTDSFGFPCTRIIMDGFISDGDIDLLRQCSPAPVYIFENTFKPYNGSRITIKPYW